MTTQALAVTQPKPDSLETALAGQLRLLRSEEFWPRAERISKLVLWKLSHSSREDAFRPYLKAHPSPSERSELLGGPSIAAAASERLKPGTTHVRKAQLGVLTLHYPVRKLDEKQWEIWANTYHQILEHVPDEVFVDACLAWLKTSADQMPRPGDLLTACERMMTMRQELWLKNCNAAPQALANWEEDHRAKG